MPYSLAALVGADLREELPGARVWTATAALTAFFNSGVADEGFRCINGSVAVSAAELEALPKGEEKVAGEEWLAWFSDPKNRNIF